MLSLYQWLLPMAYRVLVFARRFSPGVNQMMAAREGLLDRWRLADLGLNRIWFHVSSVGELEQVRPAIEALSARGFSPLLSFYSTAVPRLVKDWSFVKYADYLPLDRPSDMHALMEIVRPRLLVLNRYDLWPNHLAAARKVAVPVVLVNASTPPLGWFGHLSLWARRALFLQVRAWTFVDAAAAAAWEPYVIDRARGLVAGNPRVDRALERVENVLSEGRARENLARWRRREFCLVAGSTWPDDEKVILGAWEQLTMPRSLVLVPHEPDAAHVESLSRELRERGLTVVTYSELEAGAVSEADALVVDRRGFLAELYGLSQLAYVGGGFRREIHSIIEPAAHGVPVAFGPLYHRSPEAVTLNAAGAGHALPRARASEELARWIGEMQREGSDRRRAQEALRVFLQVHKGAGIRVADFVESCV